MLLRISRNINRLSQTWPGTAASDPTVGGPEKCDPREVTEEATEEMTEGMIEGMTMRDEPRPDRISALPDAAAEQGAIAARFREFLATRGLRMTRERVVILDAILAASDHFDAEKLYLDLRSRESLVSRATVYRTLDLLVQCGLVDRSRFASDSFSYEPIHGREHHDHMVCTACGHVTEFVSAEIERLQDEACAEHAFQAETHRLTIFGLCARCSRAHRGGETPAPWLIRSSPRHRRRPAHRRRGPPAIHTAGRASPRRWCRGSWRRPRSAR